MNQSVERFITVLASQSEIDVTGRVVAEIGCGDINGSVRPILERYSPKPYIGVDIAPGPGVDIVCDAEDLVDRLGPESVDVVVSTELLEHTERYQAVMTAMAGVLKLGGQLVVTTRAQPFPYHPCPDDFWRYSLHGLAKLFEGVSVRPEIIMPDWMMAGVLGKGTKVGRNVSLREGVPVEGVTAVSREPVVMKSPTTVEVQKLPGGDVGLDFYLGEVRGARPKVASIGMSRDEAVKTAHVILDGFGVLDEIDG